MRYDVDVLLSQVTKQAREQGIPISDQIDEKVRINTRAKTRLGACRKTGDRYQIQIAAWLLEGPEQLVRETLAHELLHTCSGCVNHGALWRAYAARMNGAYGYAIVRAVDRAAVSAPEEEGGYLLRCENCGAQIHRIRRSKLVQHPKRYRCRCGGKLVLVR